MSKFAILFPRYSTCILLLFGLVFSKSASSDVQYIIPENREAQVMEFLTPKPLPLNSVLKFIHVNNVVIESNHIIVELLNENLTVSCLISIKMDFWNNNDIKLDISLLSSDIATDENFSIYVEQYISELHSRKALARLIWKPVTSSYQKINNEDIKLDKYVLRAVLFLVVCVLIIPLLFDVFLKEKNSHLATLVLVTIIGYILRVTLVHGSIMASWDYSRKFDFEHTFYGLISLGLFHFDYQITYWDLAFKSNLAYGVLTIFLCYIHVKLWMKDNRIALCTAFFLAFLPAHIKFSNSNVQFIPSMFWTTIGFISLHYLAISQSLINKILASVLFLSSFYLNFFTRFLNLLYFPLYIGIFVILYSQKIRKKTFYLNFFIIYCILGSILVIIYINNYVIINVLTERPPIHSIILSVLFPYVNIFLDFRYTPPWIFPLAIWGSIVLYRRERRWFWSLVYWYFLFFWTHSLVRMIPIHQARYNLHMTMPVLIAASVGYIAIKHKRKLFYFIFIGTIFSPLLYYHLLSDYSYSRLKEFTFLRKYIKDIPEESVLVESAVTLECKLDTFNWYFDFNDLRKKEKFTVIKFNKKSDLEGIDEGYYFHSIFCDLWEPGPSGMNKKCEDIFKYYVLEPIAVETFPHRSFNRKMVIGVDYSAKIDVTCGLYKILGKRE